MTLSRTPSSSERGILASIRISQNVIRLGTLRSYQERTVRTKVQLLKILLHFYVYPSRILPNPVFHVLHADGGGHLCVFVRDYYCGEHLFQ
jgi:hypothetical protein